MRIHHHERTKTSSLRHFLSYQLRHFHFLSPICSSLGSSLNCILAVPSKGKKQPSTSLKTTDIFHLDNSVLSILNKGRSLSFLRSSKKTCIQCGMVSIHQQQKNILCKMLAQPQKQWSLSTRPPKWTKKKKKTICVLALQTDSSWSQGLAKVKPQR